MVCVRDGFTGSHKNTRGLGLGIIAGNDFPVDPHFVQKIAVPPFICGHQTGKNNVAEILNFAENCSVLTVSEKMPED